MATGPKIATKIAGKIKKITGKSSFTGNLAASSSAA